ncbi:MAG TPA: hypothetical protein VF942_09160 [Acidimicrobiales bacterium]
MIEVLTFRLASGTEEAEFLSADKRVQTEFFYLQPGLVRRTTARGDDGGWLVVCMWGSKENADAAGELSRGSSAVEGFLCLIDASTMATRRYTTLD